MNLKAKSAFFAILFMCMSAFAQENLIVKGQVVSAVDNMPLPGVNVLVAGTSNGTSTDFDGNYQITAIEGEVLHFSFIGFETKLVPVTNQRTLNVLLVEDANQLDEVVVIGYGTQKKSHLTGAISKVTNETLDQIAVARVDEALVGQVSGVNVQATEGEAGSAPTITIRGAGSISGSSSPLIVVDGLAVDNDFLGSLDMNEVASFEVLKDAASAAIYGSRGANGIIMITTKQGKEGETKFTYNTFTGFKEAIQSEAYYITLAESAEFELAQTGSLSSQTQYKQLLGVDNPWQNIIFDGGQIKSHSLSARGGSDKTKYAATFGYTHDEGVLLTDDYKKYNLRLKIDTKVNDKLSFGASIAPSITNKRRFDGSTHDILRQPSWLPLYHDANTIQYVNQGAIGEDGLPYDVQIGDYALQGHFDGYDLDGDPSTNGINISSTGNTNPGAKVLERHRTEDRFKIFGSMYAKYKITDGLSFRTSFAGDLQNTENRRWQGVLASRNGASAAQLDLSSQNRMHLVTDNYFTYDKTFGNHEISALLGMNAETWDVKFDAVRGTGYDSDVLQTISGASTIALAESEEYEYSLIGYFARFNYAYDNKYFASLSYRRDGNSRLGSNSKYGDFPALSAGWNVSNESFLEDSNFVSNFKLRLSYGFTGNAAIDTNSNIIDNYAYLSLLESSTAVIDGVVTNGFNPINIANPNLEWERLEEINPGVDFGFFNNVVSGSFDYYKRTSDKLIISNPISGTTGFSEALQNLGKVQNTGFELELRTRNISKEKFKWSSTFLATRNKNELLDFADSNGQILNVDDKRAAEWINLVGNPISSFYGWVVESEIPVEFINNPYTPIGNEAKDVYVKDLNGDGVIDDDDKTILGDPYPDLIWSFTNDFKIGDFDVSFMFQGSHGAEVRNIADQYIFNYFDTTGATDFISTTPNQEFTRKKIFTDAIIQDASYVALRNVNIGYNFSDDVISALGIFTKARVYATGQNLLYFTADDYTGFNPESIQTTSPTTYGYQRGGSPIARTISLGLNLEF